MKLLELTSDVVFKSFMMSEKTKEYKARLIHLITGIPESELLSATYQSIESPVKKKQDKVLKTDIIVNIEKSIISLEMNKDYYEGLFIKNNNYMNHIESSQFEKGEDYLEYKAIIQINFDNFQKYQGNKLIYEFMMREKDTNEIETDLLKSYHINLPYLKNHCYNKCNEIEKLCILFQEDIEKYKLEIKEDEIMEEAYETLENISSDEKIIGLYDAEKVEQKILNTRLKGAKQEGIQQGIEQGIQQRNMEIAKNLLSQNVDIDVIMNATGLNKEEIEKL